MFRAYSPEVRTTKDMSHFMNSNDWQRDPLSLGNHNHRFKGFVARVSRGFLY